MQGFSLSNKQTGQMQTKQQINFRMGMSPQMIAHAKLLELSSTDLKNELLSNDNPALEVQFKDREISIEEIEQKDSISSIEESDYNSPVQDSELFNQFIENSPVMPETLQEHLLKQLGESSLPSEKKGMAKLIITALDSDGFLPPIKEFRKITDGADSAELKESLEWVRRLDPIGCATFSSIESLLVQAKIRGEIPNQFENIITYDLESLSKKKFASLAKKYELTENEVEAVLDYLSELHPIPGTGFASVESQNIYVPVDLEVKVDEQSNIKLYQNEYEIPEIHVFDEFKDFDKTKSLYEDAVGIQEIIKLRKLLLKMIGQHLVEYQKKFFLKGKAYLRAEYQKDLAESFKVSESTLSRILREKYIKTPWGIFPLQYFFAAGIKGGALNKDLSKKAVQERIREIIENYSGSSKLSDQKIADSLAQMGFEISRRTVAKYRNELEIASSYDRE